MGTSISQYSPRELNWNPVLVCYKDPQIPINRVVSEIWRAADKQKVPIIQHIISQLVFKCYESTRSSDTYDQAISKITSSTIENGKNSIVVELAKRASIKAYNTPQPGQYWKSMFFSELTNYFVSRDASGFVGSKYRNKTVSDLIRFKKIINDKVVEAVSKERTEPTNLEEWKEDMENIVAGLKKYGLE